MSPTAGTNILEKKRRFPLLELERLLGGPTRKLVAIPTVLVLLRCPGFTLVLILFVCCSLYPCAVFVTGKQTAQSLSK
jgi:hypothetical protein